MALNIVDSLDKFTSNIKHGRWDLVLEQIQTLKISGSKLMDLFEQMVYEMIELGEQETAKVIIKEAIQPTGLYESQMERCLNLEHICAQPKVDIKSLYGPD